MSLQNLFKTIQSSDFSRFVGNLDHLIHAAFQLMHIVGMILVLASIVLVSLRLLNTGLSGSPLPLLTKATARLIWVGLVLLTVSGILMFAPSATNYYLNEFFWAKFLLLALALFIHLTLYRKITQSESPNVFAARLTSVVSLAVWFGVAFAGRFIGFF